MNKFLRKVMKGNNKVLLLSLPKQVTAKLNITSGDMVMFEIVGDKIELKKIEL